MLDYKAGNAFQAFLKRNILKDIIGENVLLSREFKSTVDFELQYAYIEAKNIISYSIDTKQLELIAKASKQNGKPFWYLFCTKPPKPVIDKIKAAGGNVAWFLDGTDK